VLFLFPLNLKAKYLLLAAGLISIAGVVFPIGRVAHLAHLGGLVGGLWCVNWFKVDTLLQIGDDEPLPAHVEPPTTG
jgi:membrane associated rhomboid family serine protease